MNGYLNQIVCECMLFKLIEEYEFSKNKKNALNVLKHEIGRAKYAILSIVSQGAISETWKSDEEDTKKQVYGEAVASILYADQILSGKTGEEALSAATDSAVEFFAAKPKDMTMLAAVWSEIASYAGTAFWRISTIGKEGSDFDCWIETETFVKRVYGR